LKYLSQGESQEILMSINLPRKHLGTFPTPLEPLPYFSAWLGGPQVWVKRDDHTGLAFGGNKTRKLEYLIAEAESHGAGMVLTRGAVQSNHCRQTAAAAARAQLGCQLVLAGHPPQHTTGNTLLDHLLGAKIIWSEDDDPQVRLEQAFEQAWEAGARPYMIPYGGSSPLGVVGYVQAMRELAEQDLNFDHMLLASSSGGTQAGLLVGARMVGYQGQITGISVDLPAQPLQEHIADLASQTADLLGLNQQFVVEDVSIDDAYLGDGYGIMGEVELEAVKALAEHEGLMLDPVYTGRAMAGLIGQVRTGEITPDERVLFWHTGGTPALFAYAEGLLS
jgi:D-cysteine desulfhydrase family pyridoxal phosphate-dependent enzyme